MAQTLLPLTPPLPELAPLVPFAEAPGEKPALAPATLPLPAPLGGREAYVAVLPLPDG